MFHVPDPRYLDALTNLAARRSPARSRTDPTPTIVRVIYDSPLLFADPFCKEIAARSSLSLFLLLDATTRRASSTSLTGLFNSRRWPGTFDREDSKPFRDETMLAVVWSTTDATVSQRFVARRFLPSSKSRAFTLHTGTMHWRLDGRALDCVR